MIGSSTPQSKSQPSATKASQTAARHRRSSTAGGSSLHKRDVSNCIPMSGDRASTSPRAGRDHSSTNKKKRESLQYLAPQESRLLSLPRTENGIVVIISSGDLLLDVQAYEGSVAHTFRVDTAKLISVSAYFKRLLASTEFEEGRSVKARHGELTDRYNNAVDMPSEELPRVNIEDVGMVSASIRDVRALVTDLLLILHGLEPTRKIPSSSLATLAIVADRFDAAPQLARWARAKGMLRPPPGTTAPLGEEAHRQRILVGLLLDQPQWVLSHSTQLVLHGSVRWTNADVDKSFTALWWELPRGFEDELQYRRASILAVVADLQQHLLEQYISRTRQCRLGYDTSPQCDSFQLGEFVKFLARSETLQFGSQLAEADPADDTVLDIRSLLANLKSCPSYQLDANHSHCGPRKSFVAGLAAIESCLTEGNLGLCLECWHTGAVDEWSWQQMKRPVSVHAARIFDNGELLRQQSRETHHHPRGRDLFLARERLWDLTT